MDNLKNFRRTNYCGDLRLGDTGKTVSLCGWVQRQRDLGGLIFVDLRDRTGLVQLSFDDGTDQAVFEKASSLRSEYVIAATGTVRERESKTDKIATGAIEVYVTELRLLAKAETPPFEIVEHSKANDMLRLKYRYLDLRRPDMQKMIATRHKVTKIARDYFDEQGFYDYLLRKTGYTYETLRERTWAYPEFEYNKHEKGLLRRDGTVGFATSTGRYNFYCPEMLHFGLSPLADYEEPPESPVSAPELAEKYPLVLTTGARPWGFFHSEHRQSPSMRRLHPDPTVLIHPETAAAYGIADGDWVTIENNFGSCRQKAELTTRIRKDTVSADHAWWFPERGPEDGTLFGVIESNINKLVPMRPGKVGLGASYKSQLCTIGKVEE